MNATSRPAAAPQPLTQLFLASTPLEVVFLAAGIDAGTYDSRVQPALIRASIDPEPIEQPIRRVLLLSDNAEVLEQATPVRESLGLATLFDRFDALISLNDAISPLHPNTWKPQEDDLPLFERLLRSHWQLGDGPLELILESPQVNPAIALARVFHDAHIRVSADGLMSYGPTRTRLPPSMPQRMTSLHYAPLVTDLEPRLLHETGIIAKPVPLESIGAAIAEVSASAADLVASAISGLEGERTGLIIGQYCASLGLISEDEEADLHAQMADAAVGAGCQTIVFKPHPAAPPASINALREHVTSRGLAFRLLDTPVIAEAIIAALQPKSVISAFSTTLPLVQRLYGTPVQSIGTGLLLTKLAPYPNSNRIPLTIIHSQGHSSDSRCLQDLVDAVAYCMQPQLLPEFRERAASLLQGLDAKERDVYFTSGVLSTLDLPGARAKRRNVRGVAKRTAALGEDYLTYRAKRAFRKLSTMKARSAERRRR